MHLRSAMILVIDAPVDSHKLERSCVRVSVGTEASHEYCQVRMACKLLCPAMPSLVFPVVRGA